MIIYSMKDINLRDYTVMKWFEEAFLLIKAHQIKTTRNVSIIRVRFINLLEYTMKN